MRRALAAVACVWAVLGAVACDGAGGDTAATPSPPQPGAVLVVVPAVQDGGALDRITTAASRYLEALVGVSPEIAHVGATAEASVPALAAASGAGLVLVVDAHLFGGGPVTPSTLEGAPEDAFVLIAEDVGDHVNRLDGGRGATVIWTAARDRLARQYAVYEALRRLGARFYHPEEEFVPRLPADQVRARARTPTALAPAAGDLYAPDFRHRSYSFHSAHPLEHQEAFSMAEHPIDEAVHVNDWIIKNRGDRFRGAGRPMGSAESRARRAAELETYRQLMGLRTAAGITLHNQQQGSDASIDPSGPTPVKDQIEAVVAERLAANPQAVSFAVHFGPTEFTVTPDVETVQWIDWAGAKVKALRPDLDVFVNDHITGSQPTPHFDDLGCPPGTHDDGRGDYYDLAFHTDPRLGVKVHTVMFYPLEGAAPVYNQRSFAHKLCLMQRASAEGRPLAWFPEGAWWLSFDNAVPVYLPLYMWARRRDLDLLEPLLAARGGGTLTEHRMFNSGHEWGYWQQDYAVGLWHWNADVSLDAVLAELTDPLCRPEEWPARCRAAVETERVLREVMARQVEDFLVAEDYQGRVGGFYAYFAGEDPADELAAAAGLAFRPVRVPFRTVASWSAADAARFEATDLARLAAAAAAYEAWQAELEALRPDVPAVGLPWLDELLDGVAIDGLRARQAYALYDTALALRAAGGALTPDVEARFAAAAAALARAEEVIRRREAAYRYPPAQTHGGGLTPDTAVFNGTTYPYRVHTKTHLLTYWRNRHEQVRALLDGHAGAATRLTLSPAIAAPGVPVDVAWPALPGLAGALDMGDGGALPVGADRYDYPADGGVFAVTGALQTDGSPLPVSGHLARVATRATTAPGGFTLVEPDAALARSVLSSLSPALRFGLHRGADGALVVATDPDADGRVDFHDVVAVALVDDAPDAFATAPFSLTLPIPDPSTGLPAAALGLSGARLSGALDGDRFISPLALSGELSVRDLVDALIHLAGFDEEGAYATLGDVLGFDPAAAPQTVPFTADLRLEKVTE